MRELFSFEYIVMDGNFYNSRMLKGNIDEFIFFYNWDLYLEEMIVKAAREERSIKENFVRENKNYLLDVEYIIGVDWNLRYTVYEL